MINMLDKLAIFKQPFGVVLVMGAWNYPFLLTMSPVVGAIAAGNCVILKPSEIAPATAKLLAKLIPKYLDKDCFQVVLGGIPETTALLKQKFDYIFYTGSTTVGKIVRAAANEHLTPVTLELGGKSPVFLSGAVNMAVAARRILWGKLVNAGQTCVAPDFLLCSAATRDAFLAAAKDVLREFYGPDPKSSPDFARIVSDRQFERLKGYLKCGRVAEGGGVDASQLYIAPTILVDVKVTEPVMREEIFGPILPIYTVDNARQAVEFINSRDKPLALYIFTEDEKEVNLFLQNTSSGGVCVNDVMMHVAAEGLPFGGVGASGMGAYHGKYSFDTFSHHRAVLVKNLGRLGEAAGAIRYPPYTEKKFSVMRLMLKRRPQLPRPTTGGVVLFFSGMLTMWVVSAL